MDKRGKQNRRLWLVSSPWALLVLAVAGLAWWLLSREPTTVTLKYGELVEVLQAARDNPSIRFQDVHVSQNDIRGKIVRTDPVSDGGDNGRRTTVTPFRTQRRGLENDQGLHALLNAAVGPGYQGEEEESPLKGVTSLLFVCIFVVGTGIALVLVVRWMSGGGGALPFGRSRAKVYAQQDVGITFEDVAGIDEAVAELREVVDFLKRPE